MNSSDCNDNKYDVHGDVGGDGGAKNRAVLPTSKDLEFEYQLINACYGGFDISDECKDELNCRTGRDFCIFAGRKDPELLKLFKEKGSKWVSGPCSQIVVAPYPVGFKRYVYISEYDGKESLNIDFSRAFADGLDDLLAREDSTMDDVRALRAKIDKTQKLYTNFVYSGN